MILSTYLVRLPISREKGYTWIVGASTTEEAIGFVVPKCHGITTDLNAIEIPSTASTTRGILIDNENIE